MTRQGPHREVDGRDRMGERLTMGLDPLQSLLDPFPLPHPLIIEDAECDQVHSRCDPTGRRRLTAENASNVRTMETEWRVVIRIGVLLGKVPTADHLIPGPQAASQCGMVIGNAAINDRDRLPGSIQAKTFTWLVPADSVSSLLADRCQQAARQRHEGRACRRRLRSKRSAPLLCFAYPHVIRRKRP